MRAVFTKIASIVRLFKEAVQGSEQDFTQVNINKAIFLLAIPMIVEMGMESIFAVVDIFFVSKLNDSNAVATVGYTESVLSILYSLAMGLGMGATAIIARRVGEHDKQGASTAAVQAIYLGLGVSFIISLVGTLYYKDILRLMGASEDVIINSSSYALWMFAGNYTVTLLFLINAIFRGAGNAAIAMKALMLANILNMILDPIFIFGWGPIPAFGVEGAAIATNLGRGIGVLFQLYFLLKGHSIIKIGLEQSGYKIRYYSQCNKSFRRQHSAIYNRVCQLDISDETNVNLWRKCSSRIHHCNHGYSFSRSCLPGAWPMQGLLW
jgi:putative MATE family efflux protein